MNFQPVPVDSIPLGSPLPWHLYDRNGFVVYARGEVINSREQLDAQLPSGLMQDVEAPQQDAEAGDWSEFREIAPVDLFPPQGIKPQIGERVQLLLPNQYPHRYYTTHLIGFIKNQSVIVTRPSGNTFVPPEGELVEVRMVTGSNIYAFRAAIQRFCTSPVSYMHLDYPLEVRVQKLRKSPWARVNLGVTATTEGGVHEAARLVNLSPDGGQIHGSPDLGKPGARLKLSIQVSMDELNSTLHLDATILHASQSGRDIESNLLEYGLRIDSVTAADALWLKALVYRHIAEGDMI